MDLDSRLKELGMEPMRGDRFLPMTTEELSELERTLDVRLPDAYRHLLLTYGATFFCPILKYRPVQPLPPYLSSGDAYFSYFYGPMNDPDDVYSLSWIMETLAKRMPESLIPIGNDGGDDIICLGIRGAEAGKIYYWDHEGGWSEEDFIEKGLPVPPDLKFRNVHLVAESFEDLIERLYVSDE